MPEVRFGPYTLIKRIAVGGMAEVFLARTTDSDQDEHVVVKQILPQLAEQPELLQLFFDEARIASRILHPGIVRILDVGEHDGVHFLAMEYVDGLDLSHLMRLAREETGWFPLSCALRIAIDLSRATHFAHEAKEPDGSPLEIVHRDVSPQNVLISRDGAVKLGDFGIARARIRARRTATGVLRGKIAYVSPEQYLGNRGDHRVDVYAIGVVLFELLSGRRPFVGDEAVIIKEVMSKDAPLLSSLLPDLDPRLTPIVATALARAPERRFATAEAFARALEALDLAGDQGQIAGLVRRALAHRDQSRAEAERPAPRVARPTMTLNGPNDTAPAPRVTEILSGAQDSLDDTVAADAVVPSLTPASIPPLEFALEPQTVLERHPVQSAKQALSKPVLRRSWPARSVLLMLTVMGLLFGWILSSWRADGDAALLGRRLKDGPIKTELIRALPQDDPNGTGAMVPWAPAEPAGSEAITAKIADVEAATVAAADDGLPEGDLEPSEESADGVRRAPPTAVPETRISPKRTNKRKRAKKTPIVALTPAAGASAPSTGVPQPPTKGPEREARPEPVAAQGEGELSLDSDPWSYVVVDTRELGVTPLAHVRIPAGRHRVRLENPERGLVQTITLTIRADEQLAVRIDLADGHIVRR